MNMRHRFFGAIGLMAVALTLAGLATPAQAAVTGSAAAVSASGTVDHVRQAGSLPAAVPAPPPITASMKARMAAAGRSVCYRAYIEESAWQNWVCNGQIAGTVGQSLRMEAIDIVTSGVGGICAQAQVQNLGWLPTLCGSDGVEVAVGTTGQSLRLEALALAPGTGTVCAQAHVQNQGWQDRVCGAGVQVGTVGLSLRMEAVEIWV